MAIAGKYNYKAAALLACTFMTFIYLRSPTNELQPSEEPGWSKYMDFIDQRKFMDKLDSMEQNLDKITYKTETNNSNDLQAESRSYEDDLEEESSSQQNELKTKISSNQNYTEARFSSRQNDTEIEISSNQNYTEAEIRSHQNDLKAQFSSGQNDLEGEISSRQNDPEAEIRSRQNEHEAETSSGQNDLEVEFNSRQNLLREQCAILGPKADQMIDDWGNRKATFMFLGKEKDARVCRHFKSGYSSWKTMRKTLQKESRKGPEDPVIITVRHPLVRLLSAWKDKYLGGSPLYMFDEAWRESTKTIETWATRWKRYWMLALISTGKIKTQNFPNETKNIGKSTQEAKKKLKLDMNDFRNISFTFEDFLRHVLWTYEHRVPNVHWRPTNVQCQICNITFDYILHLENSTQEVPYVLNKLGFKNHEFSRSHPSHITRKENSVSKTKIKTYADYYNEVSKDIFNRIMNLYDDDFNILGYPKEVP